jgi:D-alanyl-D-alanine carboxypeptidase/D-alanyl-D-alanine-endopeptidase (penicillin-binding protein 4)
VRHVRAAPSRVAVAVLGLAVLLAGCVPQPPADQASATSPVTSAPAASSPPAASAPPPTSSSAATSTSPVVTTSAGPTSGLTPPPGAGEDAPPPDTVLAGLSGAAARPTSAGLLAALSPLLSDPGLGSRVVLDIADAGTGESLLSRGASTPATPASTVKVLTAVATLSVLDAQERLATQVVAGTGDEVVLVAGGDMLVTAGRGRPSQVVGHAGLADLADAAAAALRAAGRARVTLTLDDTLFSGPRIASTWKPADLSAGFVAPVAPLAAENGRALAGSAAQAGDPALAAARTFATLLGGRGVTVTGAVRRGSAPAGAAAFAQVLGAPVGDVVEHMLDESDNTVAEVLARLVAARTGRPATFDGAGEAVVAAIGDLGVPTAGARIVGGSGLARGGLVAPRTLTAALLLAASPDHPELRPALSGLPIAGVSGTLADRYTSTAQRRAAGLVRAKTGTLSGASSLAGVVVGADGRFLAFAVVADRVAVTADARDALDGIATLLAGCGCP